MQNPLLEAQAEIVRAIINDLKFNGEKPFAIRDLVDNIGLYVTAFTSPGLAAFYEATVRTYARAAEYQAGIRFADILVELEGMGSDKVSFWKERYAEKQKESHRHAQCAHILMDNFLGREVEPLVREWLNELEKTEDKREHISALVSLLVNLTTDGHEDARPGSILERAWASGIRDPEPTGFDALDRVWNGGWRPKWLWCIATPSGSGKTSSAISFMSERVRRGWYTLYNSFEQPSEELLFKAICNLSGVLTLDQVEQPNKNIHSQEEWDALQWSKDQLNKFVRMYDTSKPVEEIPVRIRRHQAEFGPKMDFYIVDHIGIPESTNSGRDDDWLALMKSAYYLKNNACKQYNACGLLYSQVPSEVEREFRTTNRVTSERLGRSSKIKEALDGLTFGGRHNGKLSDGKGYDSKFENVAVFQTTKMRRDGQMSYVGLKYDPAHHRLKNEEVQLQ